MLVTLATYTFPHEAQLVRSKLEARGIPAYVADEHTLSAQWLWSTGMGGVRLQVLQEHLDDTRAVIAELAEDLVFPEAGEEGYEPEPEPEEPTFAVSESVCPHCGGALGAPVRKGKITAMLSGLLFGIVAAKPRDYRRCDGCGKHVESGA